MITDLVLTKITKITHVDAVQRIVVAILLEKDQDGE